MKDPGNEDRARTRHAVRTRLNHIVGYGDILRQDAEESGSEELEDLFARIRDAALVLRDPLERRFAAPDPSREPGSAAAEEAAAAARLSRDIYTLLFDLVSLIQDAKGRAGAGDPELSGDVDKILGAANGVIELLQLSGAAEAGETSPPPVAGPLHGLDDEAIAPAARPGRILVVDDELFNRELLARHLGRQGHEVRAVADGMSALELLAVESFDVMIIDLMMPGMNGFQLLERVKSDERWRGICVIVISALGDTQSVARCIKLGAEDYLPRQFEPVILKARLESCLEKRSLKEEQELYVAALVETQERLRAELRGGAAYVRSLLPARIAEAGLRTDWMFIPSTALGGDVFGYHRIGEEHEPAEGRLALYLIDVSGHGIEAALFSVTLLNLLKGQALPGADFGDPASVLEKLNSSFRMEEQNNLYFTAWYGVWDPVSRALSYASAGCPPAILVLPGGGAVELGSGGVIVGFDQSATYRTERVGVPRSSRLFLFSDGIYEFRTRSGGILGLETFAALLESAAARCPAGESALDSILKETQALSSRTRFLDDVSLLEFRFG